MLLGHWPCEHELLARIIIRYTPTLESKLEAEPWQNQLDLITRFYIDGCPTWRALKRPIFKRKKGFGNLSFGLIYHSKALPQPPSCDTIPLKREIFSCLEETLFMWKTGSLCLFKSETFYYFSELGIRYFLPFSLFANWLLQCSYLLSLLRYFSEICNTLFAIRYTLFAIHYSLLPLNSVIGFILVNFLYFMQVCGSGLTSTWIRFLHWTFEDFKV
jgi:hypothetical protein